MDFKAVQHFIADSWAYESNKSTIVSALEEYITIPNDSPAFDPQWAEHGHMDHAIDLLLAATSKLMAEWAAKGCKTEDITWEVLGSADKPVYNPQGQRRTPLILMEIPAQGCQAQDSVLLYGHLDKQPALEGKWSQGLGPRTPVIREGKLYGRGGGDDGYSLFSALSAIMALRAQQQAHARCVIAIEACEESGSADLEYYITSSLDRLGKISLITCLDSTCHNYDQLWTVSSLRGMVKGSLKVRVLAEGVHSGHASGVVPATFRIARQLLSRLEDENTGTIKPGTLQVEIPSFIREQIKAIAAILGDSIYNTLPFLEGVRPNTEDLAELVLDQTWRSQLAIIGLDGIPPTKGAGNVTLPELTLGLSLRLPPSLDSEQAALALKKVLEQAPPYGAKVSFDVAEGGTGNGFAAPAPAPWLANAMRNSSQACFGKDDVSMGGGGSIPFMGMLTSLFPAAQFFVTGVMGPNSNAHGPDEFLHLPMVRSVSACVAEVLAAHAGAVELSYS